jgi:DNA replication protein DnaC
MKPVAVPTTGPLSEPGSEAKHTARKQVSHDMMMNTTLDQLRSLRLQSMAQALEQQLGQAGIAAMSFEERLALLVDCEVHGRQDRRCARLLKTAKLRYPQAAIEDLDSRATRGLERSTVMSLALGEWVATRPRRLDHRPNRCGQVMGWPVHWPSMHAVGATARCISGYRGLGEELRIRHGNGTFTRWLDLLKNTDVLLLDDWGMTAMDNQTRADLLEIIDDRASHRATIITSQLPIEHWHEWIGDATMADAMLDRLMQNHHRFTLTGESMRKRSAPTKSKAMDAQLGAN